MNMRWEHGTKRLDTMYQEKILVKLMGSPSWMDMRVHLRMRG